jgi:hypothetical protein
MKIKNKILIFFSLIISIIFFILIYNAVQIAYGSKEDNYVNQKFKTIIPLNIKVFVKDKIFAYKKVPVSDSLLKERNDQVLEKIAQITKLENQLSKIEKQYIELQDNFPHLEFVGNQKINKKLNNINLTLKKYTLPILKEMGPRAYLSYYEQNLFLITGTGMIMYLSQDKIVDENFVFKKIKTNFDEIVDLNFIKENKNIVKNLLTENKSSEWFVGDKMSVADLAIWRLLGWIISGKLEHVPTTLLGTFPYLTKLYANVNSHPKVQEWMSLKYRN